jgi:hypothetical protein
LYLPVGSWWLSRLEWSFKDATVNLLNGHDLLGYRLPRIR